jgi:hypothetical protein
MAPRKAANQAEHDRVVEAWARTLARRYSSDIQISTNPGNQKGDRVGPDNDPRYPDVLVWRAESSAGRDGTAELVVEVETADSIDEHEIAEWSAYAKLPALFFLVVPTGMEEETIRLLKKRAVRVSQLWSYQLVGEEVIFRQYLELPALEQTRVVRRP